VANSIRHLQSALVAYQQQMEQIAVHVQEARASISALQTSNAALLLSEAALRAQMSDLEQMTPGSSPLVDFVLQLQSEISEDSTDDDLQQQATLVLMSALQSNLTHMHQREDDTAALVQSIRSNVSTSQMSTSAAASAALLGGVQIYITVLQTAEARLSNHIVALQSADATLQSSMSELQVEQASSLLSTLESSSSSLSVPTSLAQRVNNAGAMISQLQTDGDTAQVDAAALEGRVAAAEATISQLQGANTSTQATLAAHTERLASDDALLDQLCAAS